MPATRDDAGPANWSDVLREIREVRSGVLPDREPEAKARPETGINPSPASREFARPTAKTFE